METVTSCTKVKDWTNKEGKAIPIYGVMLSDGQGGESFNDIPVGTPMSDLKLEHGQYGLKIKWIKPAASGGFGGGGRKQSGNESFALAYAKDIAVAHIEKGKDFKATDIVAVAEVFYVWMESKKKA
jgi:hypothetical protein